MSLPVTPKQKEVLDFIVQYIHEQGFAPSYREIAVGLKLASPSTVHAHIQALRTRGYLRAGTTEASSPRELEPTEKAVHWGKSIFLPLKGLITAGQPIEAVEEREMISVPVHLIREGSASYVLKVKGESMIDEGIFDGDYVIVEQQVTAQNGDVVVALIDQTYATLKKFYREKHRVRLQPANKTMQPIYCENPLIQGIVRGLIRSFY
ncbi:transcriptional repressor LexA [Patescibacteria group bacterium]|nr:transcriptional repressor LexA [Patescibacteria group bacterium]